MLGSILSNLLLVLGSALLVGGARHSEQRFNKIAQVTNSGLLAVSVLALSLPSILDATHNGSAVANNSNANWLSGAGSLDHEAKGGDAPMWLSRFIAGLMLALYAFLIVFQLKTHTHLFSGEEGESEDEEPGVLGLHGGIVWLAIITVVISFLSKYIVDAIEGAAKSVGVPVLFLGGILLPIVGNATEHSAAVIFAWHDKMDIALASAVGSAVQVSLFVIPLCVMLGWGLGQPMDLNFHMFETVVLLLTCATASFVLMDGRSHWLKGAILILAYLMIAAAFWAHADPDSMS